MGTVKVKIRVHDAEFEAEGSREDVDAMLGVWWSKVLLDPSSPADTQVTPASPAAKPPKKSRAAKLRPASTSDGTGSDAPKFDANQLANRIKQLPNSAVLSEKIWHKSNRYNKVALVCKLAGEPLTSGDIHRVLSALRIKISLSGVSHALSNNSGKFLHSNPRKAGGTIVRYELTSAAAAELDQVINAAN